MGITQLNFENKTKEETAIGLIQQFEPREGYYLAFSGGKDSVVLYDLAEKAGVKFDAHYNRTGIDPPEVVKFIQSQYPQVEFVKPLTTMWRGIETNGLPMRQYRWCCRVLKEHSGLGRTKLTGIRRGESTGRKRRHIYEPHLYDNDTAFLNPIFLWSRREAWEFITQENLPYCTLYDEGFKRIGCILCPSNGRQQTLMQMKRFPKIAEAYKRAAIRSWQRQTPGMKRWKSGEEYFEWWVNRR